MCKIICASGNPQSLSLDKKIELEKFMRNLLLACNYDRRDDDATGMFTILNDKFTFVKKPSDVRDFIDQTPEWIYTTLERPQQKYMFHCRGAMSSASKNENNHPFVGDKVALVHEGWIEAHRQRAKELGLELTTETDSELFMRFLDDRFKKTPEIGGSSIIDETCEAIAKIANAPTSIAYVHIPTGTLMFIRNANSESHYFIWDSYYFNYKFLLPNQYILAAGLTNTFGADTSKRIGAMEITKPFTAYEI